MKRFITLLTILTMLVLGASALGKVTTCTGGECRDEYVGDASTTAFTYNFPIKLKTEVLVYVGTVLQVVDVDYTVTVGDPSGTVTMTTAPASAANVILTRNQPNEQQTDYIPNENYPPERIEADFDRNTYTDQKQDEEIGRALKFGITSLFEDIDVPDPVANKYLTWDAAGTGMANVTLSTSALFASTCYTFATLPTAGTAGTLACVTDGTGVGLVIDNGTSWEAPRAKGDIRNYGAASGTSADEAIAIEACLTALGDCHIQGPGTYNLKTAIDMNEGQTLSCSGGAVLQMDSTVSNERLIRMNGSNSSLKFDGTCVLDGQKAAGAADRSHIGVIVRNNTASGDINNILIEGLRIIDIPASDPTGIGSGDCIFVGDVDDIISDVRIVGVYCSGPVRTGIVLDWNTQDILIDGVTVTDVSGTATGSCVDLEPGGGEAKRIVITNSTFDSCDVGITVDGATDYVFSNNTFTNHRGGAFDISGSSYGSMIGNVIDLTGTATVGPGIIFRQGSATAGGNEVIGNTIRGNDINLETGGIYIQGGSHNIHFFGNTVYNTNGPCLRIDSLSPNLGVPISNVSVDGLKCIDTVDTGTDGVITVQGDESTAKRITNLTFKNIIIIDSRTGGAEADSCIKAIGTSPAEDIRTWTIDGIDCDGPAAVFAGSTALVERRPPQPVIAGVDRKITILPRIDFETLNTLTNGTVNVDVSMIDASPAGEWTGTDADIASSTATTHFKQGANSLGVTITATAIAGDNVLNPLGANEDWDTLDITSVGMWAYCNAKTVAGDFDFRIVDSVTGNTDTNFPAIFANVWQWVEIDVSALTTQMDVVTDIAIVYTNDIGAITCYFDFMARWDSAADETAFANDVIIDGVMSAESYVAATGTTRTKLVEYTDYFIHREAATRYVVSITDQSLNSGQFLYTYE